MSGNPNPSPYLIPLIFSGAGLILCLVCLPLITRRIPRNYIYGIRTPLAFSSTENWYRVNQIGGKNMLASGAATLLAGLAGFLVPSGNQLIYQSVASGICLLSVIIASIACLCIR